MKKLIIVYVVLIIALILLVLVRGGSNLLSFLPSFGGGSANAEINGNKVKLIVVDNEPAREKGLSGRDSLPEDQGMLFVFEKPGEYSFWMKDMKFAIDIIWINNDKVVHIVKNATPPAQVPAYTYYTPDEPANYVLELNSGQADKFKIKEDTTVKITGVK